ncbi:MAG TPA: hypothetical protein VM715_04705 [Candidatus Acidoferrum sp.]|jgi:hypothetical protein|nr:hypothetical protein [Candidatus Acidoferrum sp.]
MAIVLPSPKDEEDVEVAAALDWAMLCLRLNCLPGPGGLFDQEVEHVEILQVVMAAMAERKSKDKQPDGSQQ